MSLPSDQSTASLTDHGDGCLCGLCAAASDSSDYPQQNSDSLLSNAAFISGVPSYVNAVLVQNTSYYWNGGSFGNGATVTYAFPSSMPSYYSDVRTYAQSIGDTATVQLVDQMSATWSTYTAANQAKIGEIFSLISSVANINFVQVAYDNSAPAQITINSFDMAPYAGQIGRAHV